MVNNEACDVQEGYPAIGFCAGCYELVEYYADLLSRSSNLSQCSSANTTKHTVIVLGVVTMAGWLQISHLPVNLAQKRSISRHYYGVLKTYALCQNPSRHHRAA